MQRSTAPVAILLMLLAGMASLALVVLFDRVEHLALVFLIPLMLLILVVPIVHRITQGTFDLFEVIVPYSTCFFLFFGLGALFVLFVEGAASSPSVKDHLDPAVGYCTLGLACVMLGYYVTGRTVPPLLEGPGPTLSVLTLGALYGMGYLGVLFAARLESRLFLLRGSIVSGLASLCQQLSFLTIFALFYAFYLLMTRQATLGHKLLLFGGMIPTTLLGLFLRVGNKTALIIVIGVPMIAHWYAKRRFPWKTFAAFTLVVVFIVFPFYYLFRGVRGGGYTQAYRLERSIELLGRQQGSEFAEGALQTVARRLAIINATSVIIRDTGTRTEYQSGKTLVLGIISVAIPRILWPDKPVTNIGQEFGRTFHMTGFGNLSYISVTMVGELYWNFHVPGIVLGMFLMGVWMRVLYLRFGANRGAHPFRLAAYVVMMITTLTDCEAAIGGFQGAVTKQVLIFLAIEKGLDVLATIGQHRAGREGPAPALSVVR